VIQNPYESPRESGQFTPDKPKNASIVWFLPPSVVALMSFYFFDLARHTSVLRNFPSALGAFAAVFLLATAISIVGLVFYGLTNLPFRRRYLATTSSRISAGFAFAFVCLLFHQIATAIEFQGPPGIITLPPSGIAAVLADRFIARLRGRPSPLAAHAPPRDNLPL
jgi:hypothetical protein